MHYLISIIKLQRNQSVKAHFRLTKRATLSQLIFARIIFRGFYGFLSFPEQNPRDSLQNFLLAKSNPSEQFSYCPLAWVFHSQRLNNRINHIHKRDLRIIYQDYNSPLLT